MEDLKNLGKSASARSENSGKPRVSGTPGAKAVRVTDPRTCHGNSPWASSGPRFFGGSFGSFGLHASSCMSIYTDLRLDDLQGVLFLDFS